THAPQASRTSIAFNENSLIRLKTQRHYVSYRRKGKTVTIIVRTATTSKPALRVCFADCVVCRVLLFCEFRGRAVTKVLHFVGCHFGGAGRSVLSGFVWHAHPPSFSGISPPLRRISVSK